MGKYKTFSAVLTALLATTAVYAFEINSGAEADIVSDYQPDHRR